MHLMSCDDPTVQGLAKEVKRLKKENKKLAIKADRYDWLEANAKEVLLDQKRDIVTTTLLASNIRTLTSFHIEGATYG